MQVWHDRLAHTCGPYLKMMVDKGMVKGMMLSNRKNFVCNPCHLGKQRQCQRNRSKGNSLTTATAPNDVLMIDLMFPSQHYGTKYKAILVLMDSFSRYIKVVLLTTKTASMVNQRVKERILWTERQFGIRSVRRVLTDKGGEFVNAEIDAWYAVRGIEHVKVGLKSSHLNTVERQHQTIASMTKTMHSVFQCQ
ncbi:TPA: hypothetical protein N0F65_012969 [Lagenidium giganteum]|uniref:Integrase catalytic domain-containing protein n=1 Tax=Lagenidium giganteum TaxID=4803 RepID=A0AAV2Z513_9STRA|nr:TPA: hypothetical protein N0F65_012969 [Lagenidium giganteum]